MKTIIVAFSMFSRIPMPHIRWDEKNMRYMLCAFPLIGVVIAAILWGWLALSELLGFGAILFSAGLTLLPVAVTGGIHLDGFCDTSDALASRMPPERKREILKDPHLGAFGAISLAVYLLLYFALGTELARSREVLWLCGLAHVLSRCLSAFAVLCFPVTGEKGLLASFRDGALKNKALPILAVLFCLTAAAMFYIAPLIAGAMIFSALICLLTLFFVSKQQFGGMSGDLAGWFLQIDELVMLAVLIFSERVFL